MRSPLQTFTVPNHASGAAANQWMNMLNNRLHDYSHELQNARLQPRTSKCTTTATNFKMPADRVEMLLLALHYLFIDLRLVADYTQIPLNHAPVCYSAYSIQHLMVVSVLDLRYCRVLPCPDT